MQSSLILIIHLLGTTTAVLAQTSSLSSSSCNPYQVGVEPMPDIDIDRLLGKRWYVQEIFVRRAEDFVSEPTFKCVMHYVEHFFLDLLQPHMVEQYTDIQSGDSFHNASFVLFGTLEDNFAVWSVGKGFISYDYRTIYTHTDYENYGVMHWCPFGSNDTHNYERILTFTGTPSPDGSLVAQLRDKVASVGFPTDYAVQIFQHPADCNYEICVADEAGAEAAATQTCCDPTAVGPPSMPDIDVERLLKKHWYVQEMFFRGPTAELMDTPSCFIQHFKHYAYNPEILVLYDIFTNGSGFLSHTGMFGKESSDDSGDHAVWETGQIGALIKHKTVITHTDHETYGVMYWCPYPENSVVFPTERVLIFTRVSKPDLGLLRQLRSMVSSFGFPTNSSTPIAHHAECDYSCLACGINGTNNNLY